MEGSCPPIRSISLPTRLDSNPTEIANELTKLRNLSLSTSDDTSSPLRVETIQTNLARLAALYVCIEESMKSPMTQQALHHSQNRKPIEDVLEGSISVIDLCGCAKDMIFTMKGQIQELQSALRRKGRSSSTEKQFLSFITYRKKAKREISKQLRHLKGVKCNLGSLCSLLNKEDNHLGALIELMKELSNVCVSILKSLLVFLCATKSNTKIGGWSLVSRLMLTSDKGHKVCNEVESVHYALCNLHGKLGKKECGVEVKMAQRRLEALESCIQGFEGGLDYLFKCLIQNRVSLLNLLTL